MTPKAKNWSARNFRPLFLILLIGLLITGTLTNQRSYMTSSPKLHYSPPRLDNGEKPSLPSCPMKNGLYEQDTNYNKIAIMIFKTAFQ